MSRHAKPPVKRNRSAVLPAGVAYMLVVGLFLAVALGVWLLVFSTKAPAVAVNCERPDTGEAVSATSLAGEPLLAPRDIAVRVLNANGEAGQATELSEYLQALGFARPEVAPVDNDPLTPNQDLNCFGQLRFGPDFVTQPATLHSLFPCFELVQDARTDPSVDVVLGEGFQGFSDSASVRRALTSLNNGEEIPRESLGALTTTACLHSTN